MTIRTKMLSIIGVAAGVLSAVLFVSLYAIMLDNYIHMEEQYARKDIERTLATLDGRLSAIDTIALDWAAWDETCEFIQDANEKYVETNLTNESFVGLKINFMIFADSTGRMVLGKFIDLNEEQPVEIPSALQEHFAPQSVLLRHANEESVIKGILDLPEGPLLVVSRPILDSRKKGPIRGSLVMGRYLDEEEVSLLRRMTQLPLVLSPLSRKLSPIEGSGSSRKETRGDEVVHIKLIDSYYMRVYTIIKDLYGIPSFILQTDIPRNIYQQGLSHFRFLAFWLLTAVLVFAFLIHFLLDKIILSRLLHLSGTVLGIGKAQDFSTRISVDGDDELSVLTRCINEMLESLDIAKQELEILFNSLQDFVFVVNDKGRILRVNQFLLDRLGYAEGELQGMNVFDLHPENRRSEATSCFFEMLAGKRDICTIPLLARNRSEIAVETKTSVGHWREQSVVFGVSRDIGERLRAEEEIKLAIKRAEDERVRSEGIIAALGDGVCISDTEFRVLYQNKVHMDIFGDHVGEYCYRAFRGNDRVCDDCGVARSFRDGESHTMEIRSELEEGCFDVEIKASVLRDSTGNGIAGIVLVRDMTGRRKIEERIQTSLNEKEVLLKEIHHRVKNNLQIISSLLSLQIQSVSDRQAVACIQDSQNRVSSMALVHEKLYQAENLKSINLEDYIQDLTKNILLAYGIDANQIELKLNLCEIFIDIDTAMPLGLILNELIANSLKHAFPEPTRRSGKSEVTNEISIDVHRNGEESYILVFSDNGVGLPKGLGLSGTGSLGLRLISRLVDQLDGVFEFPDAGGTQFKATFKEIRYKPRR